jgi:integrase
MGEIRKRGKIYWIRYYRNGKREEESTRSTKERAAVDLLRIREGDIAKGVPVSAKIGRFRYDDAAADLVVEYRVNNRRSLDALERRVTKHLTPFFTGRRMASITTADVRAYIAHRQEQGIVAAKGQRKGERIGDVSNAEINRELTALKRMFSLALQAEKLLRRPHIPLLEERNTRTGFFELETLRDVIAHLPAALRPVITFAYITGWRVPSEVLPLQWRQVDFTAGEIRLEPETTKNRDGRVFPMTDDLRSLLEAQHEAHEDLKRSGHIAPWVFFRMVAKGRGGAKAPRPVLAFTKAWKTACKAAGCPGRIPHDLRRTAVRNMIRRGVPERVAMQLAGHKTRSVFDRYNVVSDGDLRTAAQQLCGLSGTIQGQSGTPTPIAAGETRKNVRK